MSTTAVIIGLAIVFLIVFFNNKRNLQKLRDRKGRNFKENYFRKKREDNEG